MNIKSAVTGAASRVLTHPMAKSLLSRVSGKLSEWPDMSRYSGYIFFFIAAFLIFFYVRFPQEILLSAIEKAASGAPVKIAAKGASLSFPPGVKLYEVAISDEAGNGILTADYAVARPSILSALTLKKGFVVKAETLDGRAYFYADGVGAKQTKMTIEFDGLNPALLSVWKEGAFGKVSGRLGGSGEIFFADGETMKADGYLKANLDEGWLTLSKVLAGGMGDAKIDTGVVDIGVKSGKASINRVEIKGPMMDVSVDGEVILAPDPRFSRLNLRASIKLSGPLGEKLAPLLSFFPKGPGGATTVKINGTISAPSFG